MVGRCFPLLSVLPILLLLGLLKPPAQAQTWNTQSPIPTANPINGIRAVDKSLVFTCGEFGEINRTADGGATWKRLSTGTLRKLYGLSGGRNALFTVGDSGAVLTSTDEGETWTAQTSGTHARLRAVSAVDAKTVFASGENGALLKTTDGGANWILLNSGTTRNIGSISAVDGLIAYAATSRDTMLRTADGGATWTRQYLGPIRGMDGNGAGLTSVSAVSGDTAFAVAVEVRDNSYGVPAAFRTTDAGAHWVRVDSTSGSLHYAVSAVNGSVAYVGGLGNDFMATQDGGATWLKKSLPWLDGIYVQTNRAVSAVDAQTAFVSGDIGAVFATTDGGRTWSEKPFAQTRLGLNSIFAVNRNLIFASGDVGTLLRSADGGGTWAQISIESAKTLRKTLNSIVSPDGSLVLIASTSAIFRSTDGGLGFSEITFGAPDYPEFHAITAYGTGPAYAVGRKGVVLKSVDAGVTWTRQTSGTSVELNAVQAVGPLTAYAAGDSGVFLKTVDGGATWAILPLGVNQKVLSLHFLDANVGYISGVSGLLAKTVDGGAHWTIMPPSKTNGQTYAEVHAVRAVDEKIAYASGSGGYLARTDDGGLTWSRQSTGLHNTLVSLSVVDAGTVFAAGDYGVILRSGGEIVNILHEGRPASARSRLVPDARMVSPAVVERAGRLFNMNGRILNPAKPELDHPNAPGQNP